jgi:hypothetical protein
MEPYLLQKATTRPIIEWLHPIANWIDDNLAAIKKNIERYDSGNNILQIAPLNIDQ